MSWIDIGHIDDIPLRGARLVRTGRGCVEGLKAAHS